ncbi:MAG: ATP-dependent helicase RecG, partial [Actinomycetota bacterium]|nr:ATP-dependent helicase RecG [Actinomycetota bacterium]
RQWGVDRITAGQVLRDLVDQELAVKEGGRRYAQYVLDPKISARSTGQRRDNTKPDVDEALRNRGQATTSELIEITGLARTTVLKRLRLLTATGAVVATGTVRSPRRRYRWVGGERP